MTTVTDQTSLDGAPWSIMPGWGVVADLTPPELIEMRRLRGLRKIIGLALAAVLVLCVAGYVFAMFTESSKQDALDATRDASTSLTQDRTKYAAVTRITGETNLIEGQIATLMANEVDVAALYADLRSRLPGTMSITSTNVALTAGDPTAAAAAVPASASTDGNIVGTVTMSGSAQHMADLANFLVALQSMKGVTNVLPGTNSAGAGGAASWSLTLSLTDKLLTHKYDAAKTTSTGGN